MCCHLSLGTFLRNTNNVNSECCAVVTVTAISGIALFILGCMAAAGTFSGPIGWVAVGLTSGSIFLSLAMGKFKKRKIEMATGLMIAAALITIGSLAGKGMLTQVQAGWGIIGLTLGSLPLAYLAVRPSYDCRKKVKLNESSENFSSHED